jgi:transposase
MEWLETTVLRKIYPDIDVKLDSRAYWTHFQYVTDENIELIENELMRVIKEVYKIDYSHLSFDPTNFFTYINPRKPNQELPRHGHSKEGRATLNIINLSLFCTIDGGIPLFHLAYPGNTVDAIHFKSAIVALKTRLKGLEMSPGSVVLTFDKGNLSPEGFKLIDDMGIGYICSDRPSTHKELLSIPPEEFTMHELPNGKQVGVKEFNAEKYDKERRFIAVYNPNEASWNLENLEKKIAKKIAEIEKYFAERTTFAPGERKRGQADKWRKKVEVEAKIKEMIGGEPYKDIIDFVIAGPEEIPVAEGGRLGIDLSINMTSKAETSLECGKSFLMTNQEDLPAHEVVWVYRQQYLVEQAFKWLKGNEFLSVRPMYHHVDSSIRGHIFVCYLGLVLLSLLVRELSQNGIPMSIYQAVNTLKEIKITRILIPGKADPIENVNAMDPDAKQLYDLLEMGALLKNT